MFEDAMVTGLTTFLSGEDELCERLVHHTMSVHWSTIRRNTATNHFLHDDSSYMMLESSRVDWMAPTAARGTGENVTLSGRATNLSEEQLGLHAMFQCTRALWVQCNAGRL